MTTTTFVIDRIIIEYPDPHRAHPDETATNAALAWLAPSSQRVHSTGPDTPVVLAVGIADDRPGCYCLRLNIAPTGPEGDDDQRWAPDPPRPSDAGASLRRSRRGPNGDGPRPGRGLQATPADSAQLAHSWGSPTAVAACTLTRPAHRFFDRRVSAVLVVAIAVTAFLVGRSQRPLTTATATSPALSTPPPVKSGFTGTVNPGPANSNNNTRSMTRTITADDRRALAIGARAMGVNVDTLTAMVLSDPRSRTPTVQRSVVDRLDQRRAQAADALARLDHGAGGTYQAAADAAAELQLLTFEQAIAPIDLPNLAVGGH